MPSHGSAASLTRSRGFWGGNKEGTVLVYTGAGMWDSGGYVNIRTICP